MNPDKPERVSLMDSPDIFMQLRSTLGNLNPAFKRIAIYILGNSEKVKLLRISELSRECRVSDATVSRFARSLNLRNYQELKIAIAENATNQLSGRIESERFVYDEINRNDSFEVIIDKITFKNIETLKTTRELISAEEVMKAVDVISTADTLVIYCSGSSLVAGSNLKSRFYRVGKRCLLYNDGTEQCLSAALLDKNSAVVGITSSGRTRSIVNAMRIAKQAKARTICITDSPASPVVSYSDIRFFTSSSYSSFMQDTITSRMPHILIIDILYACFAVKHYQKSLQSIEKSTNAIRDIVFFPNPK